MKKIIAIFLLFLCIVPLILIPFFVESNRVDILEFELRNTHTIKQIFKSQHWSVELESWFNDHVPFRRSAISFWSLLMRKIGVSSTDDTVILGKEDWLYLGNSKEQCVDDHRGIYNYSTDKIIITNYRIESLQKYVHLKDKEFLFIIAPDKESIYPEYLPNWYTNTGELTFKDSFIAYHQNESNVHVLDSSNRLLKEKARYSDYLYRKTDSHWSSLGGYIAYCDIIDNLNTLYCKSYNKVNMINYTVNKHDGYDLKRMLGATQGFHDFSIDVVLDNNSQHNSDFLESSKHWTSLIKYTNSNAINTESILIIRDSFMNSPLSYFTKSFSNVYAIHYRNILENSYLLDQIIDSYNPDIVIFEIVERAFKLYSDKLPKKLINYEEKFISDYSITDLKSLGEYKSNNIDKLFYDIDGLTVVTNHYDPNFAFQCPFNDTKNIILRIELTTEASDMLEVYYKEANEAFSSQKVVSRQLYKGKNIVYVPIYSEQTIDYIRIDPGKKSGEYTFSSINLSRNTEDNQ